MDHNNQHHQQHQHRNYNQQTQINNNYNNNDNNNHNNHQNQFQNGRMPPIFVMTRNPMTIHRDNMMNSQMVPQLNLNQNLNQMENILKQQQQQQQQKNKQQQHNNDKAPDNKEIPLRSDVKELKNKVNEIINQRLNRDTLPSNNDKLKKLNKDLLDLYTKKYLKHPDDINTIAAKEELEIENKGDNNSNNDNKKMNNNDILIPSNKTLNEIIILGQVLYLLALYKLEINEIEISHKYTIRALMYWRCANQHAKRMGCITNPKHSTNKSLLNEIFRINKTIGSQTPHHKFSDGTNLDIDDLGFFWPQLVECYILAGTVFFKHFEYDVSDLMYRTSLELCHCMQGRFHFSCIQSLEQLMTQSIIRHDIISSIVYTEEILNILQKINNNKNNAELINYNRYKHLHTKMVYSCLLRLTISNHKLVKAGIEIKKECIKDCELYFGKSSNTMFNVYIYFIKHCIQFSCSLNAKKHGVINDNDGDDGILQEADIMLDYLSNQFCLNRKDKKLKFYEEYHLCRVFEEYLFILLERAILFYGINGKSRKLYTNTYYNKLAQKRYRDNASHGWWKPNIVYIKRIKWLYNLHIRHVNSLNNNPQSTQFNRGMKMNRYNVECLYVDAFNAYQDDKAAALLQQDMLNRHRPRSKA